MEKRATINIRVLLISTLLVLGLAVNPARADHEHSNNVIAPLAGLLVLGALLRHNDYYYKRSKRYYGHSGHRHNHRDGYRTRSYSAEGYGRKSKHRKSKRIYRH
jgi:hypothetical protein